MSRASRRRVERANRKAAKRGEAPPKVEQEIQLRNPVSHHFPKFIFANALACDRVVKQGSAEGQSLVLCGAGPSLADHAGEYCEEADQVWGCNSALTWLASEGHPVTHGFTVDQTAHMLSEWMDAPDIEYLVASTIHPHLTDYLIDRGRRLTWFHNFVGIRERPVAYDGRMMSYEDWLYSALYPGTVRTGSGLNSVTRAIDVAIYMGFERIDVLGADCALRLKCPMPDVPHGSPEHLRWLRDETVMHADGGSALASEATPVTLGGEIDGRWWETKADMAISALWLVEMQRHYGADRLGLVGDTLPNALRDKPREFLARLPNMMDTNGNPVDIKPYTPTHLDPVEAPELDSIGMEGPDL